MATLVPCGIQLRNEFDKAFPHRDKKSDGWIADALHSSSSHHSPDESSKVLRDHDPDTKNEVHALDVDEDLRDSRTTMAECVTVILSRHRAGIDKRVTEIIYEGFIYTAARDWAKRPYSGKNPHNLHAHFSLSYVTSRENDTRPFGISDLAKREDEIMTEQDKKDIANMVVAMLRPHFAELPREVWEHHLVNAYSLQEQEAGTLLRYVPSRSPQEKTHAELASLQNKMDILVALLGTNTEETPPA